MPLDHSDLPQPNGIARNVTGLVTADLAVVVTPPSWAHSVDIIAPDGPIRVAVSGTEGSALTQYLTVGTGEGFNLPLQTDVEIAAAKPYLVSAGVSVHNIVHVYRPRGL